MNKLKSYYAYVGVPVALVAAGTILFFNAIKSTVKGNPHPEINYVIFVLVVTGMAMMLMHVHRLNREGSAIKRFFDAVARKQNGSEPFNKDQALGQESNDAHPVLDMLSGLIGKPITAVQHDALEHELTRFESKQARRLLLAQYMGGLMVGMGLLGTFIGLLGALNEIGKLIGAFGGAVTNADPVAMIQELVTRLTAPMQAMGVAFSASLFGVLGSLIMGVLLVSVKSCSSELVNQLRSLVSMETDFSGSHEGFDLDVDPLTDALEELAKQSPAFSLMSSALEQSESRVRELVMSMGALTARLAQQGSTLDALAGTLTTRTALDQRMQEAALRQQEGAERLTSQLATSLQSQGQVAQLLQAQMDQQGQFLQQTQALNVTTAQNVASQAQNQMQHLVDSLRQQLTVQYTAMQEGNARAVNAGETAQNVLAQHKDGMSQLKQWLETVASNLKTESGIRAQHGQRIEAIVEEYHNRQEQLVRQWLDLSKR